MRDHYVVTTDHGHLRIFVERNSPGQRTPALDQVEAMDFPQGRKSAADRETDMAGRFASSKHQSSAPGSPFARTGMSIDERLPMQREEGRRRAREIAAEIDAFFQLRRDASWDFAAGPELKSTVLELLSPAVRQRVKRTLAKDLVNQRGDEVRAHFAGA
ncbi:MAG: host attachment protein [Opitutaceae bacterium]